MNGVKTISGNFDGESVTFSSSVLPFAEKGEKGRKINAETCKPTLNAPGVAVRHTKEEAMEFFRAINKR